MFNANVLLHSKSVMSSLDVARTVPQPYQTWRLSDTTRVQRDINRKAQRPRSGPTNSNRVGLPLSPIAGVAQVEQRLASVTGSVDQGLAYTATPDQPRIDPDRHFKSTKDSASEIILRTILQPMVCLYNHFRLIKDWSPQQLQVNSRTGFYKQLEGNGDLVSATTAD